MEGINIATFGETDESGGNAYTVGFADYWKNGSKFTLTEDGEVTKISVYLGNNPNRNLCLTIYNVSGGNPSTLACKTETKNPNTTGWVDFTGGDLPHNLSAGDYVIACVSESDGNWQMVYQDGGTYIDRNSDTPPPSDPWGSSSQWSGKHLCIYATYTPGGGQLYEINVDAVVKASAEKAVQTTFNIEKDAAATSQAIEASEITFNVSKDAIVKSLADLGIETTFSISKDAVVKALADVVVEKVAGQLIEIFKDAIVKAQATFSLESTFNINKDAITEASATVSIETVFNVVKDAIVKASASPQVLGVYPINVDALVKASAEPELQQTLGISKDAVVVAVSTPLIQSTFNISPEAVVKVLAEVSVVKEGEVKVTKLFLVMGNIAIQIQGD